MTNGTRAAPRRPLSPQTEVPVAGGHRLRDRATPEFQLQPGQFLVKLREIFVHNIHLPTFVIRDREWKF